MINISMIEATNNIYNTNTILVSNNSINIYNLYITINKYIYNTKKELKKLSKELDIAKGGPADVQAINYEKLGSSGGSSRARDINDIYTQIKEIVDNINKLKMQLSNLMKAKRELEETFYQVAKLRKNDIEMKVFIGYYIEGKRLKEISFELYRLNNLGSKQRYNYNYIRQIHSNIKKKIEKDTEI